MNDPQKKVPAELNADFVRAILRDDVSCMAVILAQGWEIDDFKTGGLPVILAPVRGNALQALQFMVNKGVDLYPEIDKAYGGGHLDLLDAAIELKAWGSVPILLNAGANPYNVCRVDDLTGDKKRAIGSLSEAPPEVAATVRKAAKKFELVFAASENDSLHAFKLLATVPNLDMKVRDRFGKTALDYACENDDSDLVKALLNRGADANNLADDGKTPIMRVKSTEVIDSLHDANARISALTDDGKGAADFAPEDLQHYLKELAALEISHDLTIHGDVPVHGKLVIKKGPKNGGRM